MIKFKQFVKIIVILLVSLLLSTHMFSQLLYNNGAVIKAKEGAIVFVDGTVQNETGSITVDELAGLNGEIIIQSDFINNSTAGGNGYYRVLGDWKNNNTFNAGNGTVFLEGAGQLISGNVSTVFNNLTLDGSGLKTQTIDQYCNGILNLNHLELQNETFGFYVENSDVNAIIRTSGFVSAIDGGFLSRQTNSAAVYLYPVGSSLIITRYRPVEITPENANVNTYTVRMANVLATTEGYDVNALPIKICEVNPEFYHQVNHTLGTTPIELDIFFDEIADGSWDGLAQWTTTPDLWGMIMSSVIVPGVPFNEAIVANWNDFNEIPYILYNANPDATITPVGPYCFSDVAVNLTAASVGGTWSGTGITDVNLGTFDPTAAGVGNHVISYDLVVGSCSASDNITIVVNPSPDATITAAGPFCTNDASVNLSAATGGGTWSGTGITDAINGTFDPSSASAGSHIITYDVGVGLCLDSDNITIVVTNSPDPTITAAGPFCESDASVNLSAATGGGIWSGTGITDAVNGIFDPVAAGAGTHTIGYDVTVGSCTESDNINIEVFSNPDATITAAGPFCTNDASVNLSAATGGGTWSGIGIIDAVNGTFDPSSASAGSHIITYDVGVGLCLDSDNITIVVSNSPDPTITAAGPFCESDASVNLSAATGGGTWSGTGITDAVNGTFDPVAAGAGTHTIGYDVTVGSCTESDNINIEVFSNPDATITAAGPFCTNDASVNLSAATGGGTWSGTGIIDAVNGTFDPSSASAGSHIITYDVGVGLCLDSDNITIVVTNSPDATITAAGPFCESDASVNLSAATGGGTWSGTGITDAVNGTFDPSSAGAGTHTIIYDVTVGSCTESDNINIEVFSNPDATITAAGPFCTNDASVNLSAATGGGTWSGIGIIDAVNGTFDPSSASAGSHIITYDVGVGLCLDSDNITIVVSNSPDATITAAGPFCESDASVNLSAATGGGTWSGTGITDVVNGTFDPSSAGAGTHTIIYDVTVGSCTESDNINIEVFSNPDATITAAGPFCTNDASVNLSAATGGGTWSGTGITDAVNGTFDPSSASAGSHIITYDVGVGLCLDSDNITIVVSNSPDATITAAGPFCESDASVNLSAATGGGTWSGTGITDAVNGTFDSSSAGAGTHTIIYDVTVGSCTESDNINIEVFSNPDATITAVGPFCTNDASVNLSAATGGGTWTGTGITDAVNGTFDPSLASAGSHIITYDVGVGSCLDSDNITIVVNNSPDATITAAGPFCESDASVNLSAATGGGTWSGTGITDAVNGAFDPATAGAGTHTISYTVANATCSESDNIDIEVFSNPDATITAAGPFCTNDASVNLSAATGGGTWSGTGITDAINGTFDPSLASAGSHIITYDVGVGSCLDTDNITIVVSNSPDATITAAGPFCTNDASVTLSATPPSGVWSGTGITDVDNGIFDPTISGSGDHIITYDVTSGGCSGSGNITITVNETPNATISSLEPLCISDGDITLTATTTGGTWSGTGIVDATTGVFSPSTAGLGNHTITYIVFNGSCSDSDDIEIAVNDSPDGTVFPAGPFCSSSEVVTLSAATPGGVWSGQGIIDADLGLFDPSAASFGENIINYSVSIGSCVGNGSITITIMENDDATITSDSNYCLDDGKVSLTSSTNGGVWSGNGVSVGGTFDTEEAGVGIHQIVYTIESTCGGSDTVDIVIYPTDMEISYVSTNPICQGDNSGTIMLSVNGGTAPYTYYINSLESPEGSVITDLIAGNYNIVVTDTTGCGRTMIDIDIIDGAADCLSIPNAFTPNGDGVNDEWIIENIEAFPESLVMVYNRWGQKLYEGYHGADPWDGTFNGTIVPTGPYIYVVQPRQGLEDMVGIVELLR